MEKKIGYCLQCNKEQEIIVEKTMIEKDVIKYRGSCKGCGEYICLIVTLFKRNL